MPDEETTSVEFIFLRPKERLFYDDWYTQWGSTRRAYLQKFRDHVRHFDELLCRKFVRSVTVNHLFQMTGWPAVDMLQVDVEGLDAQIVARIDFTCWTPRIIRFEHMHSSAEHLSALLNRLESVGYQAFSFGFDTICVNGAEL